MRQIEPNRELKEDRRRRFNRLARYGAAIVVSALLLGVYGVWQRIKPLPIKNTSFSDLVRTNSQHTTTEYNARVFEQFYRQYTGYMFWDVKPGHNIISGRGKVIGVNKPNYSKQECYVPVLAMLARFQFVNIAEAGSLRKPFQGPSGHRPTRASVYFVNEGEKQILVIELEFSGDSFYFYQPNPPNKLTGIDSLDRIIQASNNSGLRGCDGVLLITGQTSGQNTN